MNSDIKSALLAEKIVAIIRGIGSDRIKDTVGALLEGGIKLLEVTFDQRDKEKELDTLKCLELIKKEFGEQVYLGVGTVLTAEQVKSAVSAGSEYVISPNVDIAVIQKTKELGKISIPGALTPSEMVTAYNAGADIVKLFPAGVLGTGYIKALLAPLGHIPVIAVGGINIENVDKFFKVGVKGVGVGGNLVDKKAIYAGGYYKITQTAQAYREKIEKL